MVAPEELEKHQEKIYNLFNETTRMGQIFEIIVTE